MRIFPSSNFSEGDAVKLSTSGTMCSRTHGFKDRRFFPDSRTPDDLENASIFFHLFRRNRQLCSVSTGRICNLIRRTVYRERKALYLTLFRSFVVSKFLYCSVIWTPCRARDVAGLENIQYSFLKFVAHRCKIDVSSLSLPTIRSLQK